MRTIKFLALLLIMLFTLVFVVLNAELVTVNYYFGQKSLPMALIVVASLTLGFILSALANSISIFRAKLELASLRKKLNKINKAYDELKLQQRSNSHADA